MKRYSLPLISSRKSFSDSFDIAISLQSLQISSFSTVNNQIRSKCRLTSKNIKRKVNFVPYSTLKGFEPKRYQERCNGNLLGSIMHDICTENVSDIDDNDSNSRSHDENGNFIMFEPCRKFIDFDNIANTDLKQLNLIEIEKIFQMIESDIKSSTGSFDPFNCVSYELSTMNSNIQDLLGTDHPVLNRVAKYFFNNKSGKKIRPALVLLFAKIFPAKKYENQKRLAEISELIHTASLLHDDVVDDASKRRGIQSVNSQFGNKVAILGGDFVLARASVHLARLRNLDVVEVMSTVIEHLVKGEMIQLHAPSDKSNRFRSYILKNYFKTGSLISNSILSSVLLSEIGQRRDIQRIAFEYGENIGHCFQLIDDCLDFEASKTFNLSFNLGKPSLNDVRHGLATAPVLYALNQYPELDSLIERKFSAEGDIEKVLDRVEISKSTVTTRSLARIYAMSAVRQAIQLESILPEPKNETCINAIHSLKYLPAVILNRTS